MRARRQQRRAARQELAQYVRITTGLVDRLRDEEDLEGADELADELEDRIRLAKEEHERVMRNPGGYCDD